MSEVDMPYTMVIIEETSAHNTMDPAALSYEAMGAAIIAQLNARLATLTSPVVVSHNALEPSRFRNLISHYFLVSHS
jgi:hypothetical protein